MIHKPSIHTPMIHAPSTHQLSTDKPSWLTVVPALPLALLAVQVLRMGWNVPWFEQLRPVLLAAMAGYAEPFWSACTLLGDALVTPLLVIPFLPRRPQLAWASLLAALVATVLTHAVKPLLHLPRPPAVLDLTVIGPRLLAGSFPSGHTTTAFTVFVLLWLAGGLRGPVAWSAGLLLAVLVALSRVAVGAHWPADLLAGAAAGWVSAWLALRLAARWPIAPTGRLAGLLPLVLGGLAMVDLFGHDTGYPAGMFLQQGVAALMLGALAFQHPGVRRRGMP